jgi:hypothetical protein
LMPVASPVDDANHAIEHSPARDSRHIRQLPRISRQVMMQTPTPNAQQPRWR